MNFNLFTTKQCKEYITLFFLGDFAGNYDNWDEIRAAKSELLHA